MTPQTFLTVLDRLTELGWARNDIAWAESVREPESAEAFAIEAIFVICNSGMKFEIAQKIFERCKLALWGGTPVIEVFGHKGKAAAIEQIWRDRTAMFEQYRAAEDKLAFLAALPWIGDITKYHLAKNLGLDVAKPDVHLVRLAEAYGTTPQDLCERLAQITGLRVATIDTLLWRACAVGVLNSRTGALDDFGFKVKEKSGGADEHSIPD